jgi:hypothetical protein
MNIKITLAILLASCLAGCTGTQSAAPELSKADATKLLEVMGDKNIVVAGVVNGIGGMGIGAFSSPSVAMVIAYAERDGIPQERTETFFYDKQLGWFHYEIDKNGRRVRLWTTTGYKELKPAPARD